MLLKFTYYVQCYAQEQELLSDYYTFICNFACMSNSLHVAENFIKTVLLECINERYQSTSIGSIIR